MIEDFNDLLRPALAPEPCNCAMLEAVVLVNQLTDNPLQCNSCGKTVEPERLQLSEDEIRAISGWNSIANALYRLWLDSSEYEEYAKARLLDPHGHINRRGLDVAKALRSKLPTWFWFFHDAEDELPENCPLCRTPLDPNAEWAQRRCVSCMVYV